MADTLTLSGFGLTGIGKTITILRRYQTGGVTAVEFIYCSGCLEVVLVGFLKDFKKVYRY
ncbi:MAG: hypothetical protein NOU37_09820 [Candidatus Brocadiales bacterium]|nr:hypothetical protein [Candidatus Bathyanammoxibius amoris]